MNSIPPDIAIHMTQQKASGLNKLAYCRQAKISYDRFQYWIRPQKGKSGVTPALKEPAAFIELPRRQVIAKAPDSHAMGAVTIHVAHTISLIVPVATDPDWLGRVIAAVRPC